MAALCRPTFFLVPPTCPAQGHRITRRQAIEAVSVTGKSATSVAVNRIASVAVNCMWLMLTGMHSCKGEVDDIRKNSILLGTRRQPPDRQCRRWHRSSGNA